MGRHEKPIPGPLTDALRRALRDSGTPMLALAKAAGVERMSLVRFARGERSLRLDKADRLAAYFGLALVKRG
jgi:plasmid maintenance system antidote protein VapI